MKITKLIFLSISFILLLFSFTTYVNYKQSEKVRDNSEFLSMSSTIVRLSNQFQRNILYMERGVKGYLATGEQYLLQTYDSAAIENTSILNELASDIPANSTQSEQLTKINSLYKAWLNQFINPLLNKNRSGSFDSISPVKLQQILREEERINKTLQQEFRELLNVEYNTRTERRKILERSEQQTKVISVLFTALSIVAGFIVAVLLARHISRRISKMVKMANTIAGGNYNVQVEDKGNDELSDLTRSLNHMAQTLEENISLLKRKNQELDQFAHIVSHDLKAPMRGIDNVINWIEEDHHDEIPPKVSEYLQLIKGRIRRSENLIQGILSYAKIGQEVAVKEKVDTKKLVEEIADNVLVNSNVKISIDEKMPVFNTERIPLTQVFSNLISNAVKYNNNDNPEVNIYCKEHKRYYDFFVEDNGPGIDPKYHDRVFVIFQTLHPRDSLESTGVGLAIVKKILDDRKEQIKIISEPGKGATFSFTWSK